MLSSLSVPSSSGKSFQRPLGKLPIQPLSLLSVPSSSGKSFQHGASQWDIGAKIPFSPLFIGEELSTKGWKMPPNTVYVFQSPLHRGRAFNVALLIAFVGGSLIFQSPLHRGRAFNIGYMVHKIADLLDFQSPLHRGRAFNACTQTAYHLGLAFQSPLHRGRAFNYGVTVVVIDAKKLSVPSSSGKSFQQRSLIQARVLSGPFSPLFIGEELSTCAADPAAFARLYLSVPSSSGKSFQLLLILNVFNTL